MPSIFVFLQLQSTCTGIVQAFAIKSMSNTAHVAIYMHGYSASSGAEVLFVIWLVAIYTWFRG